MRPRVKTRIAIAMTALVAVNLLTAAVSWGYTARATRLSEVARASSAQASAIEQAAHRVTRFVSDGNSLALAVNRSSASEEVSARYGEIQGSELGSDHALQMVRSAGADSASAYQQWEQLRLATYLWINREAETAGSGLRLTRDAQGRYRASVSTNLHAPLDLAALDSAGLRNAVRLRSQSLVDGSLRRLAHDAQADATLAAQQEDQARMMAAQATLALIALSLVTAIAAAVWLYRSIAAPLQRARVYAECVAAGDLDAVYTSHTDDEIGSLTHAIEDMKNSVVRRIAIMQEMAGAVLVTADDVDKAAQHALQGAKSNMSSEAVADDIVAVVGHAKILTDLAAQMLRE